MAVDQGYRVGQRLGQQAVGKAQRAIFAIGGGMHHLQGHAGQLGQRGFELAGHGGHVFGQLQMQRGAHVLQDFGQAVQPAQAAEVHSARKLVQGHGGQVVAFVKNHQAVVQVRQGLGA